MRTKIEAFLYISTIISSYKEMVAYYLNCLICGCGWDDNDQGVFTGDTELLFQYISKEDYNLTEFPKNLIEDALHLKKIDKNVANTLKQGFKCLDEHKWMRDVIAILPDKVITVNLEKEDYYEVSDIDTGSAISWSHLDHKNYMEKGYIMHKCCYDFIRLEHNLASLSDLRSKGNLDLSYENINRLDNIKLAKKGTIVENINYNKFKGSYGVAENYIGEYGVFYNHSAYLENPHLLLDPNINQQNGTRILKLMSLIFS